jgi:hypothetical protein
MRKEKSLDPYIMNQFTGSEHWYRFGIVPNITCTDGAKYVADTAGRLLFVGGVLISPSSRPRPRLMHCSRSSTGRGRTRSATPKFCARCKA